jgi:hypothetical protein
MDYDRTAQKNRGTNVTAGRLEPAVSKPYSA